MNNATPEPIVIVGAGQAGGWAAKTLRSERFAGRIVLLGDEAHPPHERPPLSKAVLAGEAAPEATHLFKPEDFAKLDLDCRPGARVAAIDRAARTITLQTGEAIAYGRLILCTGSRARTLGVPGADAPGVRYLRTIDDALALQAQLVAGRHLIVIGGGWIGLEVAATARKRGLDVTVIEALDRLCARALPVEVSEHLLALHMRHGVTVRRGVGVSAIETSGSGITVVLADGHRIAGDQVVVGVGVVPNTELAAAAGLAVDNGIVVDDAGRTTDPAIFAAGDCTNLPLACLDRRVRLESWANAQNQAIVAAKTALGQDVRYDELPWFWSDQYDMNLQMLGYPAHWPESVVRGDPASGSFSRFYLEDGHLSAIVSINAPRDLRAARKLLQARKPVRPEDLVNPAIQLQRL
ncbi:NAD(P)/FAD-dependent oxidoreductase [Reyranella sp. CPCC 100927]|uniref:NAD(P)/FAD-dependent oxidoreductase n=1 Tax=Reyranella sp. CPCC 100927 TaxID=2599616 RepID=UPI0011B3F2E2|nr:FAD-dependent oxidoreductase [Reyranella sp. CPCC 100927]TWT10576.1 pyridine nucleotide-disulfide oxidoreductase [Reyranella sp. CPCC 100927]